MEHGNDVSTKASCIMSITWRYESTKLRPTATKRCVLLGCCFTSLDDIKDRTPVLINVPSVPDVSGYEMVDGLQEGDANPMRIVVLHSIRRRLPGPLHKDDTHKTRSVNNFW